MITRQHRKQIRARVCELLILAQYQTDLYPEPRKAIFIELILTIQPLAYSEDLDDNRSYATLYTLIIDEFHVNFNLASEAKQILNRCNHVVITRWDSHEQRQHLLNFKPRWLHYKNKAVKIMRASIETYTYQNFVKVQEMVKNANGY